MFADYIACRLGNSAVRVLEAASTQLYIFLKHTTATLGKNMLHQWGLTRSKVSAMIFLPLKD